MSTFDRSSSIEKARVVFGEAVVDDHEASLTYSPSPQKLRQQPTDASFSSFNTVQTTSFVSTQVSSSRRPVSGPFDSIILDTSDAPSGKENSMEESTDTATATIKVATKKATRSSLRRDLVKRTQDAIRKAAVSVNASLNNARAAKAQEFQSKKTITAKVRQELEDEQALAKKFHARAEQSRFKMLTLRKNLASKGSQERAQKRINKRHVQIQEIDKEAMFKSAVYREHQKMLKEEEERRRRMSVAARAKVRENHKEGEQRLERYRLQHEQAVFEERHEASVALKVSKQEIAQQRRKSFAFRNGDAGRIRQLHASWEAKRLQDEHESYELEWAADRDADATKRKLEEDRRRSLASRGKHLVKQRSESALQHATHRKAEHESYELKWAGERDAHLYDKQLEKQRRESFAGRNEAGRRQRERALEIRQNHLTAEHESYEMKWAGERDALGYQLKVEKDRRESLAFRNKQGKEQRDLKSRQHAERLVQEHESYELEFTGHRDADAYCRKLAEEQRMSLEGRNVHARDQRQQEAREKSEQLAAEHASFELKWAGEKDAEAYKQELEKQRRESLASRNRERVDHAKVMDELRTIAREQHTESLVLKWAGENDAKAYLKKLEAERRKSLQKRGEEVVHHREVDQQEHANEIQRAAEDETWHAGAQKDVEAYQKECAARERASLQYRRKEARIRRLEDEERALRQQALDHVDFELETQARSDIEEYLSSCKERRRLSLAYRAKEKRRHANYYRQRAEKERAAISRDVRGRLMDQRYAELAVQEERSKKALDSIRHAGCSFNPFMDL